MEKLILWDLDGTLIDSGGALEPALFESLSEALGEPVSRSDVSFSGKTHPQIAQDVLKEHGVSEAGIDVIVRKTMRLLGPKCASLREELRTRGRVLDGVVPLLKFLSRQSLIQSVLTGNLAVNAVLKVETFGIARYLDMEVGAYGSDHTDRNKLVEVAFRRVEKLRNAWIEPDATWVIGDTPADYVAAKNSDAHCLLVATGTYCLEELQALGADAVLPDLADTGTVAEIILGGL